MPHGPDVFHRACQGLDRIIVTRVYGRSRADRPGGNNLRLSLHVNYYLRLQVRPETTLKMGRCPRRIPSRSRWPDGSTASPTPSATSWRRRRLSRRAGNASGTSTSAIRSRLAFRPRHISSKPSQRAMRDGHNGYLPSAGIPEAREAVAADYTARGIAVSPDRVLITTGTSEGIELALNALVDEGDEVLVPSPTYPLYTAVLAKIAAQPRYYRTDPEHDWLPDLDHLRTLVTPRTRVLVVIDPNNPTGAVYPAADSPRAHRLCGAARPDDSGRRGLRRSRLTTGRCRCSGRSIPMRRSFRSRVCRRRIWRQAGGPDGWSSAARRDWMTRVAAIKKLADGRLCSPGPMQYAVAAALTGDRSHQVSFRAALAERARITTERLNAIPGMRCVAPRAAFYALPRSRCRRDAPMRTSCSRCCVRPASCA